MLRPLRVAVLTSGRPHGVRDLLARGRGRGLTWDVVAAGSSASEPSPEPWASCGVPFFSEPILPFLARRGLTLRDPWAREVYDRGLLAHLAPYDVDLVVLAGYLYVLSPVFLGRYPGRVVNVHHADLLRLDAHGRPLFPGLHAVRDAIRAGETSTRATAHVVTDVVDGGPVIARSTAYPVSPLAGWALATGAHEALRAYTRAHEEWMLATAWAPLLEAAIASFVRTEVQVPAEASA
jgi:phosphoribosylglycinamide formyltransferase-1